MRGSDLHGYTNWTYPQTALAENVLTVQYYDDYDFLGGDLSYDFQPAEAIEGCVVERTGIVGLTTGTKTKVLGVTEDQWLTSVTYYDAEYRSIQSIADLYPEGREVVSNVHNFTGDVIETHVRRGRRDVWLFQVV